MTFSEFVLKARRILHDIRDKDGQIITDASEDGVRWSSLLVQDLCQDAVVELLRILTAFKLFQFSSTGSFYQIISGGKIEAGTGLVVSTDLDAVKWSSILKIQTTDLKRIYSPISQDEFFLHRYLTSQLVDGSQPIDDAVLTLLFDKTNKKMVIRTLPLPAQEITNIEIIVRTPFTDLLTLNAVEQLPIYDCEDILIKLVEREARRIEHNPQQVEEVGKLIERKIAEMTSGLQRSS